MKKSDDTFSNIDDEALNDISDTNKEGEDMQSQAVLKISDDVKIDAYMPKLVAERRSANSDRRINDNFNYKGPARRMNLDRRK